MLVNGTAATAKGAHLRLCHSRMLFARACSRETQAMVFDAEPWPSLGGDGLGEAAHRGG